MPRPGGQAGRPGLGPGGNRGRAVKPGGGWGWGRAVTEAGRSSPAVTQAGRSGRRRL